TLGALRYTASALRFGGLLTALVSPHAVVQQFCGHAEMTLPPGRVMVRKSPDRDPSLARLASAVTALLRAASTSVLLISRSRKKPGDGPSSDQVCTSAPFFVETISSI